METNSPDRAPANADAAAFMVRLARALHDYGTAAHQIEDGLTALAARLGLDARFLATPTSIVVASGPLMNERIHLIRVEPGQNDLGRLAAVVEVSLAVGSGAVSPAEGSIRLAAIEAAPPPYGATIMVLAMGLSSAAASRFLGGGPRELVVASVIGVLIGLLDLLARRAPALGRLFDPAAAVLASLVAGAASHLVGAFSVYLATLAGIIILIPGLTLTVAVTELANRHLVAGTARLSGAFASMVVIVMGVAIGGTLAGALFGAAATAAPAPMPAWTEAVALLAAPLAFTVLLKAQPRDAPWIMLACAAGFFATRLGARLLGPDLGVFAGALTVGLAGSVYGHVARRPAAILRVPGILLLVPGSIGFRGLTALLDRQVVPGVETAFRMITMATALAAGLLIASVVAPSRLTVPRGAGA